MIFCWFLIGRIREAKMKRLQTDQDPQHWFILNRLVHGIKHFILVIQMLNFAV